MYLGYPSYPLSPAHRLELVHDVWTDIMQSQAVPGPGPWTWVLSYQEPTILFYSSSSNRTRKKKKQKERSRGRLREETVITTPSLPEISLSLFTFPLLIITVEPDITIHTTIITTLLRVCVPFFNCLYFFAIFAAKTYYIPFFFSRRKTNRIGCPSTLSKKYTHFLVSNRQC